MLGTGLTGKAARTTSSKLSLTTNLLTYCLASSQVWENVKEDIHPELSLPGSVTCSRSCAWQLFLRRPLVDGAENAGQQKSLPGIGNQLYPADSRGHAGFLSAA